MGRPFPRGGQTLSDAAALKETYAVCIRYVIDRNEAGAESENELRELVRHSPQLGIPE